MFKTKGFLDCDRRVLSHIVNLDSLSCSEIDMFEACMNWVKAASKQSDVNDKTMMAHLGSSFYDIRFGSMTADELNGIYSSYPNLFTTEIRTKIATMIQSKSVSERMDTGSLSRQCAWDKERLLECKRSTGESTDPCYVHGKHTTTFTTTKQLLLREISCAQLLEYSEAFFNGKVNHRRILWHNEKTETFDHSLCR